MRQDRQADPARIERFGREMVALGKLDHPHIVRALDAGDEQGIHYLVMEYVDGVDLGRVLKQQGTLNVSDACQAAHQAALGLAYVHRHGRVHRDIKPSNLMISTDGTVKLLDLGLAHVEEYTIDESSGGTLDDILGQPHVDLTRTHQVMGTLEYMAPEQATDSHAVDHRADIYSLGCTLYKLLTGSSPFATSGSITAMSQLVDHVQKPAPPVAQYRRDVPRPVAELLDRMLAKNPQQRPATADEIASVLAPYGEEAHLETLVGEAATWSDRSTDQGATGPTRPASPAPVPLPYDPSARDTRRSFPMGVLLVLIPLVLAVLLGIWWWTQDEGVVLVQESPEASAVLDQENAFLVHEENGIRSIIIRYRFN